MVYKKILLLVIFASVMASAVSSIGVSPSSMDVLYEEGKPVIETFFGENKNSEDASVKLFVIGEMAEYVALSVNKSVLRGMGKEEFTFTINPPENLSPGPHTAKIYIEETSTPESFLAGGQGVGAKGAVIMPVTLKVPYDGKYLEARFKPMRALLPGETIFITLDVFNYGGKDLRDIKGFFRILKEDESELDSFETTTLILLRPSESGDLRGYWTIPNDAEKGEYTIEAIVNYGGDNPATARADMRIGEESIDITEVRTENIRPGGVGKFLIDVKSAWNRDMEDVYAEIHIFDGQVQIDSVRTPAIDIGRFGKGTLEGYWEIGSETKDEYIANVVVHYADKTAEANVKFGPDMEARIETPARILDRPFAVGMVIMSLVIVLLLSFVILLLMKNIETRKQKGGKAKSRKKR